MTQQAFECLLAELAPDREQAGARYESLRRKLVKFFEWRGCGFPEDLADETLNRLAMNLEQGQQIAHLEAYVIGIARLVFLESLRAREREEAVRSAQPQEVATPADSERRQQCLDCCLQNLPPENLKLIMDYYREDQRGRIANRRELAARLTLPLNALRIRACRIRAEMEACVTKCLGRLDETNPRSDH